MARRLGYVSGNYRRRSALKTIDELQDMAYKIAFMPKPTKAQANKLPTWGAKLFEYWKTHKHVGVPYRLEDEVVGGGYALITSGGYVLYWDGTENDVQEL